MIKFEVGKKYNRNGGEALEVIKRTADTITYIMYQHSGRTNERIYKQGRAKVRAWGHDNGYEAALVGRELIESIIEWEA